jgi:DNA repair exonuclease SbcCD ATPase subunit
MAWLNQFFNRNTYQEPSTSTPPEAAAPNPPKPPGSTTMMQLIAEETIMAVAQWLVNLVNHHIQTKPEVVADPVPTPTDNPTTGTDELVSKFGKLIEQLYEREQRLVPLESRLQQVEAALIKQSELHRQFQKSTQQIEPLNQRLIRVEDLAGRVDVYEIDTLIETTEQLSQQVDQSSSAIARIDLRMVRLEAEMEQYDSLRDEIHQIQQSMAVLEHRMGHLEKLLSRFSVVPKLVEENRHGITLLQRQLTLKATTNHNQPASQNGSSVHLSDANGSKRMEDEEVKKM